MSKYSRDPTDIAKDLCIALAHPIYRNQTAIETLRELKEARR